MWHLPVDSRRVAARSVVLSENSPTEFENSPTDFFYFAVEFLKSAALFPETSALSGRNAATPSEKQSIQYVQNPR